MTNQGTGNVSRELELSEERIQELLQAAGKRPHIPTDDFKKIKAAAREEWRGVTASDADSAPSNRGGRAGVLALAAGLILTVGLGWFWVRSSSPVAPRAVASIDFVHGEVVSGGEAIGVGASLTEGMEIRTRPAQAGERSYASIRMRGGHSVRLDSGSRLRLKSVDSLALLAGAVYVDSKPVLDLPAGLERTEGGSITIETPFGAVQDIGTQFEVRLTEAAQAPLRVRVREGVVSLKAKEASVQAEAGQELSLLEDGSVVRAEIPIYGEAWAWILGAAPGLEIEGLSLDVFLKWVGRETGWQIRYGTQGLAVSSSSIELHGTIEGLSIDESVSVVLPGSGLDYQIQEGTMLVTSREQR